MLWFLIVFLVAGVIGALAPEWWRGFTFCVIGGLGVLAVTICLIFSSADSAKRTPDRYTTTRTNIETMADGVGSEGEGRFGAFGGGHFVIRQAGNFTFYVKNGDAYELKSISSDGAKIYLDSQDPYVEYQCVRDGKFEWHAWSIKRGKGTQRSCTYYFHVPEGSIVEDINLDGQ